MCSFLGIFKERGSLGLYLKLFCLGSSTSFPTYLLFIVIEACIV